MCEIKAVITCILTFVCTLCLLWLLLTASAAIPNADLFDNMMKSLEYYSTAEAFQFTNGAKLSSVGDNYADCILLSISEEMGEGDCVVAALDTQYYRGDAMGLGVNEAFFASFLDKAAPDTDYSRYWHGMAMPVRAVHLFGDVQTVKLLGFCTFLGFVLLTLTILIRQKNYKTAIALTIALLCIHPWNLRLSMEYQSPFVLCFILCPIYLLAERKRPRLLPVLAVIGGTAVAFFDFLTCETVAILLPLLLVTAVRIEEGRFAGFKRSFAEMLLCGVAFFAAYAGTFLAKWTLASCFTGENKFVLALSAAELHTAGDGMNDVAPANTLVRILLAPIANLTVLFGGEQRTDGVRVLLGLLLTAAILGSFLYLFKKKDIQKSGIGLLFLMSSVVLLRYMLLNYHSYVHAFFTYRALLSPIFAVFAAVLFCSTLPHGRKEVRLK